MANINQRLNGLEPLAYAGVNAVQPPDFITRPVDPTTSDSRNFYLGAIWLNTATEVVWILVSLVGGVATWVMISGASGSILTLTGNTGGMISPLAGNINVVGDGTTISVAGNAATHTLTIETVGTGVVNTLTGNNAVAVSPTAGNINVIGDGTTITITGNAGTHTLTASLIGGGGPAITGLESQDGHVVTPTTGTVQISGSNGIATTGTVGPNTLTITAGGSIAQSFITSPATGTATPAAGILTFAGASGITASASGSTVTFTGTGSGTEGLVKIQTKVVSGVTSVTFTTGLTTTYNNYLLLISNLSVASASSIMFTSLSTNGGATYITTGYESTEPGLLTGSNPLAVTTAIMTTNTTLYNMTSGSGYIMATGYYSTYDTSGMSYHDNNLVDLYLTPGIVVNAIKLSWDSGSAFSGNFSLYGYVN